MNIFGRTGGRVQFLGGVSSVAMVLFLTGGGQALAQQAGSEEPETITVSSSRITSTGFNAPTPTTVIDSADIEQNAQTNIFDAVNQLPVFSGSQATTTNNRGISAGNNGVDALNLRNLGTNRNITLLDGRRVVGANLTGIVDVSSLPQSLVERVDVVTGGASAAWGADAVGGVVNFILNKNFTGFKAEVAGGVTTYGDDANQKVTLTAGTSFLGGRGRLITSAEWTHSDGLDHATRPWYQGTQLIEYSLAQVNNTTLNPNKGPQYLVRQHASYAYIAAGGIITSGPLAGTAFGANGAPFKLDVGTIDYCNAAKGTTAYFACMPANNNEFYGGDWKNNNIGDYAALQTSNKRESFFAHADYSLSDHAQVFFEASYANVTTGPTPDSPNYKANSLTMKCSNPFLPTSLAATCGASTATFTMGVTTTLTQPGIPPITLRNARDTYRFAGGANGDFTVFGTNIKWDLSGTQGDTIISNIVYNNNLTNLYALAVDATRSASGQVVCASAAAQAAGCTPLNVFGTDTQSPAAWDWVLGTAFQHYNLREQTGSLTFNAQPLELWAGPVSTAFGVEWRQESVAGYADCASTGNCGNPLLKSGGTNWMNGNYHVYPGSYNTKEIFGEVATPLAHDLPFAEELTLDVAGRYTKYSTADWSGTYKFGLTWTPIDDVRFRATRSMDARAPNLSELYGSSTNINTNITDNKAGPNFNTSYPYASVTVGALGTNPELARSSDLGIVLTPTLFPGFEASVDYFDISLTGVIRALGSQTVEQTCDINGNAQSCAQITRDPTTGKITQIINKPLNFGTQHVMGYDFEAAYHFSLPDYTDLPGDVTLHALATNTVSNKTNTLVPGTIATEGAGAGVPKWNINLSQNYDLERLKFGLVERIFSSGVLSNNLIQCTSACPVATANYGTIDDNHKPGVAYLDLSVAYDMQKGNDGSLLEWYLKVDNVLNRSPGQTGSTGTQDWTSPGVDTGGIYDLLGRMFRIGVRYRM